MAVVSESTVVRRDAIVEAATSVFLRFGYRKTSMDDLARAAGLSRQGLYLHFATKDTLFAAGIDRLAVRSLAAAREALARDGQSPAERLLGAFTAFHGQFVGPASQHMSELLEAATAILGKVPHDVQAEFLGEVVRVLKNGGVLAKWKDVGVTAKELAEQLNAMSTGWKHTVATSAEYRDRMRMATRLICG